MAVGKIIEEVADQWRHHGSRFGKVNIHLDAITSLKVGESIVTAIKIISSNFIDFRRARVATFEELIGCCFLDCYDQRNH